jgi:hypothetical protein
MSPTRNRLHFSTFAFAEQELIYAILITNFSVDIVRVIYLDIHWKGCQADEQALRMPCSVLLSKIIFLRCTSSVNVYQWREHGGALYTLYYRSLPALPSRCVKPVRNKPSQATSYGVQTANWHGQHIFWFLSSQSRLGFVHCWSHTVLMKWQQITFIWNKSEFTRWIWF